MSTVVLLKKRYHVLLDAFSARRRGLKRLRSKWGKPGEKDRSGVSGYFDLTRNASPSRVVDDKTWTDLEFPRIYAELDSTETPLGSQ